MTPDKDLVVQRIVAIQAGDIQAREDFLYEYKPFVAKTTCNFCRRPLSWENSDELSTALIAFNSAIDSYDPEKRVPFLPYAKVVVQNRLKDLFRKTSRLQVEQPLETTTDEGKTLNPAEIQAAWEDFLDRTIEDERREELEDYELLLDQFGVDFESLVDTCPRHRDSRFTLFRVAGHIASHPEIMEFLLKKKQLPISELVQQTGVNRKTLERGRKFIIAASLVLHQPMRFTYIRSYINVEAD